MGLDFLFRNGLDNVTTSLVNIGVRSYAYTLYVEEDGNIYNKPAVTLPDKRVTHANGKSLQIHQTSALFMVIQIHPQLTVSLNF